MSLFRHFSVLKQTWPVLLIIVVAAVLQLFLATRPIDFLLTNVLPDDAFYYFEIARNIAGGAGSTFDGITQTNGYHPLWMVILVGIYHMVAGAVAPIHAALVLSVAMNVATAVFVYGILRRVTENQFARFYGMLFWSLNPFLLYETLNGLETSLALLLLSAFLFVLTRPGVGNRTSLLALLGVLGGAMVLARLDLLFYLAAAAGILALTISPTRIIRTGLLVGGVSALIVAPFFLWNLSTFGMLLTSASGANTLVNHVLIEQDHGLSLYQTIKATAYTIDGQIDELLTHTGAPEVTLGFAGTGLALVLLGYLRLPRTRQELVLLYALPLGFAALFFANVVVRWTGRSWYFVSFGILCSLLAVLVIDQLSRRTTLPLRGKRIVAGTLTLLTLGLFFVSWHRELTDHMPQHREMYAAAEWFNEHVPSDTVIGSFNSGIIGYFTDATVINLDGLVNNDAYEAMQDRKLWVYIESTEISYLVDFDIYLDYRYRSFFGVSDIREHLVPVERVVRGSHARSTTGIAIYTLQPHD